jgi:hypothetical protein
MKSFSILLARSETVAAAGSSSGERGLLAETDFLLPLALDEFTIPVRSKTRRGELGLWRLARTDFLRLGSAPGCNASPARTLGALAERTLSNRTRTLRVPRKRTFLRVFLRDCVIA